MEIATGNSGLPLDEYTKAATRLRVWVFSFSESRFKEGSRGVVGLVGLDRNPHRMGRC